MASEAAEPSVQTTTEPAPSVPQPTEPPANSSLGGFAILILALIAAVIFLQRSRKAKSGDDEAAPKKEGKPKAAKADADAKAPDVAEGAAAAKPDVGESCCVVCGTEMPMLTWRGTERMWLLCCGKQMCKGCHADTAEKIREASIAADDGTTHAVPDCPGCSSSLQLPDSVAMEKLREQAEAGSAWAQYELGYRCEMGLQGVEQNLADAAYWYGLAHDQGYGLAAACLGALYLVGWEGVEKDYAEAKRLLKPAASKGDARAQRFLAQIYDGGLGVPPSQSDSIMWLEMAAEQGFAAAQADLGFMYEHGRGVTRSIKSARKWYKLAAEQGERNAQFLLGGLLLNTRGEKALPTAMRLCRQAASQAHLDAIDTLLQMESNLKRSCAHCRGFKEGLTRCSRCKAAYYCNGECQMAHWKAGHAQECCDSGPDCSHILAMAAGAQQGQQ